MTSTPTRLFSQLPKESIARFSNILAKTCTLECAKAKQFEVDFKHQPTGVYFRAVDDMRAECSRLTYSGELKNCSASVISEGPTHQSVYHPNTLPALGFLISGTAPSTAISRGLFLETPQNQSQADITAIRENIVSRLKDGDTSSPHQATRFYAPRQSGVNEAHVRYTAKDIAAYALPLSPSQTLEACLSHRTEADLPPEAARTRAKTLRMVAQLAYAATYLGVKPVFTFRDGKLSRVTFKHSEWSNLLSQLNQVSEDRYLLKVADNHSDHDRPAAQGITSAAIQLQALEKPLDPHAIKHIGGPLTRIPVDILTALYNYTNQR
jgi:hypothetical protein